MNRNLLLCLLLITIYLYSCRYNKVSVQVKNCSDYDFKSLTVRFGDTLQIFKDLKKGDRSKRFWSNTTYGKGYTKVVLPSEDTVIYFPINQRGQRIYYHEKILAKIKIEKTKEQRDTIIVKTRRRFLF